MEKKHTTEKKVISSLEELRAAAKGSEEDESEG
jgi:hypothetical protein